MRKSKCSDSQILAILKQNEEGVSVQELCREHGMSTAQFIEWRGKPAAIRIDNGPENTAQAMVGWANKQQITLIMKMKGAA